MCQMQSPSENYHHVIFEERVEVLLLLFQKKILICIIVSAIYREVSSVANEHTNELMIESPQQLT